MARRVDNMLKAPPTFMALGLGWPAPLNWCATKKAIFSLVFPGLMTYQVSRRTRPSSI